MSERLTPPSYDAFAQEYERVAVPVYRVFAKRLLQLIDLRPGWRVLDAGTGTGLVALLAAPRVGKTGQVIGVDASTEMLNLARTKAARFGFSQCEFRVGDLNALDLPDASFNAALAQFSLHHTDLGKSLRELQRVLMSGGQLVLLEWGHEPRTPHAVLFEILQAFRVSPPNETLARVRRQAETARLFRENIAQSGVLEAAMREAGFGGIQMREERFAMRLDGVNAFCALALASPLLRAELDALSEATREAYWRQAQEALAAFQTARGFEWMYRIVVIAAHT